MTPHPRVTVIVPHLDDEAGLARCLAALERCRREPDAPPAEIIVVDNGSLRLPRSVCDAVPGVRLAAEGTPGPGPARNCGVALARAPVLAFIDADCVATPRWLAAIARHFDDPAAAPIIGGAVGIAMPDPRQPTAVEAHEAVFGYRQRLYVERHGYSASCNMALRRTVFETVGPFAGIDTAEDADWGHRAGALGFRIAYSPEMRVTTPARADFAALARKWDRHIAHARAQRTAGPLSRGRWVLSALAVGLSPLAEIPRIVMSDRLPGASARCKALACTTRIRLWRAWRMLRPATASGGGAAGAWRAGRICGS